MSAEKSYLCPLFWQHHEEEAVLREELQRMKENGIGGFIVEARPHPDYLEENWWKDLTILLDEAKKLDMEMWIFDDGDYPSGKANGLLVKKYPELTKRYMAVQSIDAGSGEKPLRPHRCVAASRGRTSLCAGRKTYRP